MNRWDRLGEMRLMAESDGYVMASRAGCVPFVMAREEWDKLDQIPTEDYGYESAKWARVPPA